MLPRGDSAGWCVQVVAFSDLDDLPVNVLDVSAHIIHFTVSYRCDQLTRVATLCVIAKRSAAVCVRGQFSGAGP